MASVSFLNPPFHYRFSRESRSPAVNKSGTLYYPKWLCYAAAYARKSGHHIDVIDAPASGASIEAVIERIKSHNSSYLIVETSTPSIVNDIKVVKQIKEEFGEKLNVLMAGRHISAMPEETSLLIKDKATFALREYEVTTCEWIHALESGKSLVDVDGLAFWDPETNTLNRNKERAPLEDLDEIPWVTPIYKEFLNIADYYYGHSLHPLVVFDTSRGCPFKCTFCVYPQTFSGHTMRYRSAKDVASEFKYVKKNFPGVKTIMLEDDTFPVDRKRTIAVCDELIKIKNTIPFDCNARADNISGDEEADKQFYTKLKQAGARLFCVGIESGDNEVLRHIKKALDLDKTRKFASLTKKIGIKIHGCFMFGNLNETRETLHKTLDLAMELQPDTAQFFPIMVYPGTAAFEEAKKRGLLKTTDFSAWLTDEGLHNSVVDLPGLSSEDLVRFCDYSRRKFYTNPKYVLRKLIQSLFSFSEFKRNAKGAISLSKYLIRGSRV